MLATPGMIHGRASAPMPASTQITTPTARYAHLYMDIYLLIFSVSLAAICSYKR